MKTIRWWIALGLLCSTVLANEMVLEDAQDQTDMGTLIYSVKLRIIPGSSMWTDTFPATGETPLRVVFVAEPSCRVIPYTTTEVRVAESQKWEPTRQSKDGFEHYSGGAIDGIRLKFDEPAAFAQHCTLHVYSEKGMATAPVPTSKEKLVGAIYYGGGFIISNLLEFKDTPFVTHFRVEIPKFCQDVEVLGASTYTEQIEDVATLADAKTHTFAVNGGAGSRISKISVSLNGPSTTDCTLPIYITEK